MRLATAEKFNKDYDVAIEHYKEAIAMYTNLGLHDKAQDTHNSLNLCYAYAGKPMDNTEESEKTPRKK